MFLLARWLLLIWTVWFFALFLPGHDRGMLLLPGETSEAGCPMCVTGTLVVQRDDQDTPAQSPDKPCGRCAVCQFMATIANVQAPPSQLAVSWLIGWSDRQALRLPLDNLTQPNPPSADIEPAATHTRLPRYR